MYIKSLYFVTFKVTDRVLVTLFSLKYILYISQVHSIHISQVHSMHGGALDPQRQGH